MGALPDATQTKGRAALLRALAFAAVYFGGAELGYALSLGPTVGGTFWPPAGVSLAVFLAAPRRDWPLLLCAGLAANYLSDLLHGQTLPASIGFAITNLGQPLLGAVVLRRILGAPVTLTRLPELLALGLVVAFVSVPISSAIGAQAAQWWTEDPPGFAQGWRTWWVGDAVGALVLAPCVLRILTDWRRARAVPARLWAEAAAYALVLAAVTQFVFTGLPTSLAAPFLVFPVMLWGSLRFGPIGVGGALCLVVVLATHDTVGGLGPFAAEHLSLGDRLVALQVYVGVMAVTFHAMALLWEERARAAAALREAHAGLEARYRRIVEQSPLAILAVRRDGVVREANPAWRRLLEPAAGAPEAPDAQRPWDDARLRPLLARAFAGEVVELPERAVDLVLDGAPARRRVRGFAYPVTDEAGRVAEVVRIEQDVTEERATQQQLLDANRALREREEALSRVLRQMEETQAHREQLLEAERFARGEAERASRLKDEFLATLSHELRTPLNAIVGWAHILRQTADAPELTQAVDTIERNARAQAKLIDDLLDMSRILAGKVELSLARVRLADVAAAAVDALQPLASQKGVALVVDASEAAGAWVSCDPARLQQVLTNLLGNGVKFTPAGGRVELRVERGAHDVRVVVRDTGQGIAPEFLPAVFERFRQADGSTTRRHGGLGLGLSIARQIVELHDGSIHAHSEGRDRGATFTVALPLAADPAAGADPERAGERLPSIADLRVLVVDDEADASELLRRLLTEHGCRVDTVASAAEALAALAGRAYDVLLTDISMPAMDGYELLRRVRTGGPRVPRAIAVTALARPQDRARALAAGFDGHLAKPIDPTRLLQLLHRLASAARAAAAEDAAAG
jgi:signal transduction histidine kinase/CheY-like chemotaxis protein/integral membrane sensor domain MASE1